MENPKVGDSPGELGQAEHRESPDSIPFVGFAIVAHGSGGLGTFGIADLLLGALGLSQAIYVTGKAVPVSIPDYNKKLDETRCEPSHASLEL